MTRLAQALAKYGILRSGGADGADSAFEKGCDLANGQKEIYLPWKNFNNNLSPLFKITNEAKELAATIHPAWDNLSWGAKKLHARNCYQILGFQLNQPVDFVVCYTDESLPYGGTKTALALARRYNRPIYNLHKMTEEEVKLALGLTDEY